MSAHTTTPARSITGRNFRTEIARSIRTNVGADAVITFEPRMETRSFIGKGDPVKFTTRRINFIVYRPNVGLTRWIARSTSDERGRGDLHVIQVG